MNSVPCVEDVGSTGKSSHLKYHCRRSQERSGTLLIQTLTKCSWQGSRQDNLCGMFIEDSDMARLSPSKPCPEPLGRIPAKATQLTPYSSAPCSSPASTSGFQSDSTGIQLEPFTVSARRLFSRINKRDQLPVQLHKHHRQDKGRGREPLSAALSLSSQFGILR